MGDDENKTNNSGQNTQNNTLWQEGSTDTIIKPLKKKKNNYVNAEKE